MVSAWASTSTPVLVLVLVPDHAPPQPAKVEPDSGVAVRTTVCPSGKEAAHVAPQLIPAGLLVTLPEPEPAFPTVRVNIGAAGRGSYSNSSAGTDAEVPFAVTTATATLVPAGPAGLVAVTSVSETTITLAAVPAPNFTLVAPVRCSPVIVTDVPPTAGPFAGSILVTVGAG